MEDCRIARQVADWNPQGKRRRGRPASTWKDGIRDRMQRGNLKDEECFDPEIWRVEKNFVFTEKFIYTYCHELSDCRRGIGLSTGFTGLQCTIYSYTLYNTTVYFIVFPLDRVSSRLGPGPPADPTILRGLAYSINPSRL
jgi:hypothetical protein